MKTNLLIVAGLLGISSVGFGRTDEVSQTMEFRDVAALIERKITEHGGKNTLLVFDIDNTTMKFTQDIGSEHWFLWQQALIRERPGDPSAIAATVDDALRLQGYLTNILPMIPVEPQIPVKLKHYGEQGARMMTLTSRMPDVNDATQRELRRNGFPYERYAPGPGQGLAGKFIPYDLRDLPRYGLTPEEAREFKLPEAREVVYSRGAYLTQGQHKGVMLKTLLHKLRLRFDAIIFVDDRVHHLEGMRKAFESDPVMVSTVEYLHERPVTERFLNADKTDVIARWQKFAAGMRAIQAPSQP